MSLYTFNYGGSNFTLYQSKQYIAAQFKYPSADNKTLSRSIDDEKMQLGKFSIFQVPASRAIDFSGVEDALTDLEEQESIAFSTPVFHTANQEEVPVVPTGQLYVVFNKQATMADCRALLQEHGLSIIEKRNKYTFIVNITPPHDPILTTIALQKSSLITIAEPELATTITTNSFALPTDTLLKDMWHLQNKGKHGDWPDDVFKTGADAKVVEAWQYLRSLGSRQLTVAVIDNGFDLYHPDLRGDGTKIVAPWDFDTDTPNPSAKIGDWHGTPCAGVAVGAANGVGTVGAAPNCKLMPLRFAYISDSQIERWFTYAMENGADIISNSWGASSAGFRMSTRQINAIKKAATEGRDGKGCVILFAAGNSGASINDPIDPESITLFATHPNVITVAASNSKDERSKYSNYGKQISVCAPSNGSKGAGITAADVGGTIPLQGGGFGYQGYDEGQYTTGFGGTSSACPLVAGVAALILSVNPSLTAVDVKDILEKTAVKIGESKLYDSSGHSLFFGYGRIDALAAVKKAQTHQVGSSKLANPSGTGHKKGQIAADPVQGSGKGFDPKAPDVEAPVNLPARYLPLQAMISTRGQASGKYHEELFKITIPNRVKIKLDSQAFGSNFDVFVKRNAMPSPEDNDGKGIQATSKEEIVLDNVWAGDYYILVRTEAGKGEYKVEVKLANEA